MIPATQRPVGSERRPRLRSPRAGAHCSPGAASAPVCPGPPRLPRAPTRPRTPRRAGVGSPRASPSAQCRPSLARSPGATAPHGARSVPTSAPLPGGHKGGEAAAQAPRRPVTCHNMAPSLLHLLPSLSPPSARSRARRQKGAGGRGARPPAPPACGLPSAAPAPRGYSRAGWRRWSRSGRWDTPARPPAPSSSSCRSRWAPLLPASPPARPGLTTTWRGGTGTARARLNLPARSPRPPPPLGPPPLPAPAPPRLRAPARPAGRRREEAAAPGPFRRACAACRPSARAERLGNVPVPVLPAARQR